MKLKAVKTNNSMTLDEIIKILGDAGCENPRGEAYILAEHFCGVPRSHLVLMKDSPLESEKLSEAVAKRASHVPLQYIIGKWSFMNEVYEVTPDVLIPRPDTEILVEYGISNIKKGGVFADLCTGSGCVAVSALAARDDLTCAAVEKYPSALNVAKRNAAANGVDGRITFFEADVTEDFLPPDMMFDAVLTNPPYVTPEEYETLSPEVKAEPRHALTDGVSGLSIIEKIIEIYPRHLKDDAFIAIEMGAEQGDALRALAAGHNLSAEILKDYSGRERVAVLRTAQTARKADIRYSKGEGK